MTKTGNLGLDALADAIADRVVDKIIVAPAPTLSEELQRLMEGRLNEYVIDPYHQAIERRKKTPGGRPKALAIASEKIVALRGDASQKAFSRLCKISIDTLQRAERGFATEKTIFKFCKYSAKKSQNLTPEDLKNKTDREEPLNLNAAS